MLGALGVTKNVMGRVSDETDALASPEPSRWSLAGGLTFFPISAILHHLVFRRHSCILNMVGPDYYPSVIVRWAKADPSPWIALAAAIAVSLFASKRSVLRSWIWGFLFAFLPLSVWLWDIPFTGGFVCRTLHDGRSEVRSWHLYLFAAVAVLPLALLFDGRRLSHVPTRQLKTSRRALRSPRPIVSYVDPPVYDGLPPMKQPSDLV
jgi:hypothetical protein